MSGGGNRIAFFRRDALDAEPIEILAEEDRQGDGTRRIVLMRDEYANYEADRGVERFNTNAKTSLRTMRHLVHTAILSEPFIQSLPL